MPLKVTIWHFNDKLDGIMKQLIEFLAMNLGRLLATLLGVTVLPMRWLLGLALNVLVSTLLIIGLIIASPIITAILLSQLNLSKFYVILVSLVIAPVVAVSLAIANLALNAIFWPFLVTENVFKYINIGFKQGLRDGLGGFIRAWNDQITPWTTIAQSIRVFFNRRAQPRQQAGIDQREFDRLQQIAEDVAIVTLPYDQRPAQNLAIENTQESWAPLNQEEITQFDNLLATSDPQAINLTICFERYKSLSTSLEKTQQCIIDNQHEDIEDALIPFTEVNSPIFFFKQYKCNNQWLSVPAVGYITDEQGLRTWLQSQSTHPINRENINQPNRYTLNGESYETRYRYHALTAQDCSVQELREGAAKIRLVLRAQPNSAPRSSIGSGSGLFSTAPLMQASPTAIVDSSPAP